MRAAIEEALKGLKEGGVPIGAVLVEDGKIDRRLCEFYRFCPYFS